MGIDRHGNWDGVCACGKQALDGVMCRYGATHLNGFSDGVSYRKQERVRERLPEPERPRRKRERLDLFDTDDD